MSDLTLVIGSRRTSSWSLRPWLMMRQVEIPFDERVIDLRRPDTRERILEWSPSGRVPVLVAHGVKIWDSLAIGEFLAEMQPALWPDDAEARAIARSISAEMHSGFADLRAMMPMDVTSRFGPPGRLTRGTARDIQRITEIWRECRGHFGGDGPFLFGQFSIADAMYAPVCSRFTTYALPLDDVSQRYVATIMELPAMRAWIDASREGGEAPTRAPVTAPEPPARRPEPVEPAMPRRSDPPPRLAEPAPVQQVALSQTPVEMPAPPMPPAPVAPPPVAASAPSPPRPLPAAQSPAPQPRQTLVVNVPPTAPRPVAMQPDEPPAPPPPVPVDAPMTAPPSRGLPEFRFRSLFRSQPRVPDDVEPEFPVVRVDDRGFGPVAPTIAQGQRTVPPASQPRREPPPEPPAETKPLPEPPAREEAVQRGEAPRQRTPFDIGTIKPIGDGIRRRR